MFPFLLMNQLQIVTLLMKENQRLVHTRCYGTHQENFE